MSYPCCLFIGEIAGVTDVPLPMWIMMKSTNNSEQPYLMPAQCSTHNHNTTSHLFTTHSSCCHRTAAEPAAAAESFADIRTNTNYELSARGSEGNNEQAIGVMTPSHQSNKLSNAAKNILVMISMFLSCSTVLLLCGIPNLFSSMHCLNRTILVTASKSIFYINGFSYPVWYLFCTRKVRNVVCRALYQHQWL